MLSKYCKITFARSSALFHAGRGISGGPITRKDEFDIVVIGGGIVGTATAREMAIRFPNLKLAVVEKEDRLAAHQSGNNSGVVHAGIYYVPGSLKAKLCVRGLNLSYKYFDEHNIPYKKCGKLIVAVDPVEVSRLDVLYQRGLANEVRDLQVIDGQKIKEIEPHCRGLKAIFSPHTGIVDWGFVTKSFGADFEKRGGSVFKNFEVSEFKLSPEKDKAYPLTLVAKDAKQAPLHCKYAIACTGLQSDRVATLSGCSKLPKIVPFRGEYLLLKPEKRHLASANIYPVPDPRFPFLGVHFTPRMNGDVWLGPNAVLAFKREGYKYTDFSFRDLLESISFRGMQKLMLKYTAYGMGEMYRSLNTRAQVKLLQRFVPELRYEDVIRGPAGVRAQALDASGNLVDDFVFDSGVGELGHRLLHVRNAPSPACTSSLAIAEMVADKAKESFHL